ncbi:metalloregulator ArsR/SmtB family transcription factor [bacterium]|nr:metalloregulator ArsR/SmtB family transcription factor [bacterium]
MTDEEALCQVEEIHQEIVESVKNKITDSGVLLELANLFKALGDFTRIRILDVLTNAELCVCDLVEIMQMSQPAISHQLRVLRAAKIVKYRKEGKNVFYSLDDEHVSRLLKEGMNHVIEG